MRILMNLSGAIAALLGLPLHATQSHWVYTIKMNSLSQDQKIELYESFLQNELLDGVDIYEENDYLVFDCFGCNINLYEASQTIDRPDNLTTK